MISRVNDSFPGQKRPFRLQDLQDVWQGLNTALGAGVKDVPRVLSGFELNADGTTLSAGVLAFNGKLYEHADTDGYRITVGQNVYAGEVPSEDDMRALEDGKVIPMYYYQVLSVNGEGFTLVGEFTLENIKKWSAFGSEESVFEEAGFAAYSNTPAITSYAFKNQAVGDLLNSGVTVTLKDGNTFFNLCPRTKQSDELFFVTVTKIQNTYLFQDVLNLVKPLGVWTCGEYARRVDMTLNEDGTILGFSSAKKINFLVNSGLQSNGVDVVLANNHGAIANVLIPNLQSFLTSSPLNAEVGVSTETGAALDRAFIAGQLVKLTDANNTHYSVTIQKFNRLTAPSRYVCYLTVPVLLPSPSLNAQMLYIGFQVNVSATPVSISVVNRETLTIDNSADLMATVNVPGLKTLLLTSNDVMQIAPESHDILVDALGRGKNIRLKDGSFSVDLAYFARTNTNIFSFTTPSAEMDGANPVSMTFGLLTFITQTSPAAARVIQGSRRTFSTGGGIPPDDSITNAMLKSGCVTGNKIELKTIQTGNLENYCVTKDKIASGAVSTSAIAQGCITFDMFASSGMPNLVMSFLLRVGGSYVPVYNPHGLTLTVTDMSESRRVVLSKQIRNILVHATVNDENAAVTAFASIEATRQTGFEVRVLGFKIQQWNTYNSLSVAINLYGTVL